MPLLLKFPETEVTIEAIQGDITSFQTGAIVNSANAAMVLGGRKSVASRINLLTEGRLEEELADKELYPKPVSFGEVCVTGGDLLPCKYVFHLSTHGTLEEMVEAADSLEVDEELPQRLQMVLLETIRVGVRNLIRLGEEHQLDSLSFPLIGSGTLNLPKPLAIEVLVGTLTSFLSKNPPSFINKITIVTPEEPVFRFLSEYLEQLEPEWPEPSADSSVEEHLMMNMELPIESRRFDFEDEFEDEVDSSLHQMKSEPIPIKDTIASQNFPYEVYGEISELRQKLLEYKASNEQLMHENRVLQSEIEDLDRQVGLLRNEQNPIGNGETPEAWERMDLPLPLAYAQNIRISEEEPTRRLINTMTAIGIVAKYFASLFCAEYMSEECFDAKVNRQVLERLKQNSVTDGSWRWIGVTIARGYREATRRGSVIEEFPRLWINPDGSWSEFSETLRDLTNRRNEIHDPVNADPAHAAHWLEQVEPLWQKMCQLTEELLKYELIFIDEIQELLENGKIRYSVKHLRGGFFIPKSDSIELEKKLKRYRLYLLNPETKSVLELNPFMVYEYSQVTNSRETYCLDHIQPTKFQYRAFRYAHLHYMNHGGMIPFHR